MNIFKKIKRWSKKKHIPGKPTPLWRAVLLEQRIPGKYKNGILRLIKFYLKTKKIIKTKSLNSNPNAKTEIHSLVCHRDLYIYLAAIKSFLRFYKDISIVVHNDGSLKKKDKKILKEHIKGIKIIEKKYADKIVNKELAHLPECRALRDWRANFKQVFDFNILNKTKKIVSFDSDMLILKRPEKIIKWIKEKNNKILYHSNPEKTPCGKLLTKEKIPCLGDVYCGFTCYYKDIFKYNNVEKKIKKLKGKEGWFWAQMHFDYSIYDSKYNPIALNTKKYFIKNYFMEKYKEIPEKAKLVHFPTTMRYSDLEYAGLIEELVEELK